MDQNICVFCGCESKMRLLSDDSRIFNCNNCGHYGIEDKLYYDIRNKGEREKLQCTHLLSEHSTLTTNPILLTSNQEGRFNEFIQKPYAAFIDTYPKDPLEIFDRTLLNLSRMIKYPADRIQISPTSKGIFFARNVEDMFYTLRQLSSQNAINFTGAIPGAVTIESQGWEKIRFLKRNTPGETKQVFVAIWFDESRSLTYTDGIKSAIESVGNYKAMRIDSLEHNGKICDQIVAEIKKSKFLVADFTGGRGGVYYEAGFAQGLGLPVIWIVQQDDPTELHFDTRQYNHIFYKDSSDLKAKLIARIEATIV